MQGRRLEKARALIEATLKADPGKACHHDTCGWVLFKQGELKPALKETQKAIRLQGTPPNYYHHRNLGHIQAALGNYKQAANAFVKALKLDPYLAGSGDEKASFHKVLEKAGATKAAAHLKKLQAKNKINA